MIGYRIVSERELKESLNQKELLKNEEHLPYRPGQLVFFFQGNNRKSIFNRHSNTLADLRSLDQNDFLYLLKLKNLVEEKVEIDASQNGWGDSYVYFGNIYIEDVSVVGFGRVLNGTEGFYDVSDLEEYPTEMPINEIL